MDEILKLLVGILALASTAFSLYAASRARENAMKVEANTNRIEELTESNKELKELVASINHHVNGKMDDLLKVSVEMAVLKGSAQERESRDKKDAEAAQAILIAKGEEAQEVKVVNTPAEPAITKSTK